MTQNSGELTPLLERRGICRTDMDCHHCREKGLKDRFVAKIDYSLNGNHEIQCPRCGHIHYRVIKDGKVTEERYNSSHITHVVERRNVWAAETVPIVSTTASAFMRDLWLNGNR